MRNLLCVLTFVFLALSAADVSAQRNGTVAEKRLVPHSAKYTSQDNKRLNLFQWEGEYAVILTPTRDLDAAVMKKILDAIDRACVYYRDITGHTPGVDRQRSSRGRILIAVVDDIEGKRATGARGTTGIEIEQRSFDVLCKEVRENNRFHPLLFYELERNHFSIDHVIGYGNNRCVSTGFASLMQYTSMDAAGVESSTPAHREQAKEVLGYYVRDTRYSWHNTLAADRGVAHPTPALQRSQDLMASILHHLYDNHGGDEFLRRFFKAAKESSKSRDIEESRDKFAALCCIAAEENLLPFFLEELRWPVASQAQDFIRKIEARKWDLASVR